MAKRKLSEEEKKAAEEQHKNTLLANQLEEALNCFMPKNPTYFFEIGEKVTYGAHPNAKIVEIYENGLAYKVRLYGNKQVYHNTVEYDEFQTVPWINLRKFVTPEEQEKRIRFSKDDNVYLKQYNQAISSIFTSSYHFGMDLNVNYQREHVWSIEDKEALIDSILNKIEIGKFIFIRRPFNKTDPKAASYEVLDGKQRMTAITEFYEDRITYKGLTFSQLHWRDKIAFEQYQISYMEGENLTEKQILETFIKFNTHGKVMSKEHLKKVQEMLDKLNKNEL
jgi:hypothetical protein